MKVIHLISGGDTGGAKTHIHYLLAGLNKSIEATLVCFTRGEFSDEAQALGIPTVVFDGANIFSAVSRLKTMIKDGGYDLIHSHGAKGNFVASLIKRSCGLPVVTTVHSDPKLDYLGRPMAKLVYGNLNAYALKRADYSWACRTPCGSFLFPRLLSEQCFFHLQRHGFFGFAENSDKTAYFRALALKRTATASLWVSLRGLTGQGRGDARAWLCRSVKDLSSAQARHSRRRTADGGAQRACRTVSAFRKGYASWAGSRT